MTSPFEYFKQASYQALIDRHKQKTPDRFLFKGGVRMVRACQNPDCAVLQPDNQAINSTCVKCGSDVLLWIQAAGK